MKKFLHRNRNFIFFGIALAIFFTLVFIILFIIDRSYLTGYEKKILPNTTYSASDWITFWGSLAGGLFGAIIAIAGVYLTMEHNQNLSDENLRESIKPVISINKLLTKYEGNFIASLIADIDPKVTEPKLIPVEDNIEFREYKIESIYFTINDSQINISSELNQDQLRSIKDNWKRGIRVNNNQVNSLDFSYTPCFVTSCGNGAAINTTFMLKKENIDSSEIFSQPVNLKKDADLKIGFYCYLSDETFGNYSLIIEYYDIHGEKYSQRLRNLFSVNSSQEYPSFFNNRMTCQRNNVFRSATPL